MRPCSETICRHAAQDANAQPLLLMAEQKDLQKRHQASWGAERGARPGAEAAAAIINPC